jgi:hypothetical protein
MVENSAALFRGGKGVLKHPEDRVHVGAVVQRETLDLLIGQPARRKPVSHKLSADSLVKEGHRATTPLRAAHPAVEASRATRSAFPEPTDGGSASRPPRARREIRQLADHRRISSRSPLVSRSLRTPWSAPTCRTRLRSKPTPASQFSQGALAAIGPKGGR